MRIGQKGTKRNGKSSREKTSKAPKYIPKLARDPIDAHKRATVNLVANPGGGKTGTALSISENWGKKKAVLDDLIHVGWDETPLVGFTATGIRVPYHFDVREVMVAKNCGFIDASRWIVDEAAEICDKVGGIKAYIDDTASMLDFFWTAELAQNYESPQLYLILKREFQSYRMNCVMLPGAPRLIACFHLTEPPIEILDRKDPKAKDKRRAKDLIVQGEGGALLTPAVGNSLKKYFFGAGSLEILCRSYRSTKGAWVYEIRLDDYKNVRTKNRFRDVVEGAHPSNLRELFATIEKGIK